jgi:polyphosphate kinase
MEFLMKTKEYEKALEKLQIELNEMARWLQHTGKRALVIVEGRDTAGKGGVINAISSCLPPRHCRSVALTKPSDIEKTPALYCSLAVGRRNGAI